MKIPTQVKEWERLKEERGLESREALWAGWDAVEEARESGLAYIADRVATETLKLARSLLEKENSQDEYALRDLSVSLENMGYLLKKMKLEDESRKYYEEALIIAQRLNRVFPGNRVYKEDLERIERMLAS